MVGSKTTDAGGHQTGGLESRDRRNARTVVLEANPHTEASIALPTLHSNTVDRTAHHT